MKIRINKEFLIIFFLLIPFMQPDCTREINILSNIYIYGKVVSSMLIILFYLKDIKKIKNFSKIFWSIFIFECTYIFIAIYYKYNVDKTLAFFASIMFFLTIIEYYSKKNMKMLINVLLVHFEILVYMNLLSILIFPKGMYNAKTLYPGWFLGIDNIHIFILLPSLCISCVKSYMDKGKITLRTYMLYIAIAIQIIIRQSATSIVGLILMTIFIILYKRMENSKIFNFRNYMIIAIGLFCGIVIFRIQNFPPLSFFIENILGRRVTLTGRIYIWDYVFKMIIQRPIIGYGTAPILNIPFPTYNFNAEHAHSLFINIMYNGGIILSIEFIIINILLGKNLMKYKDGGETKIFSYFIFVFYIITIDEVNNMKFIFMLFLIAYNINNNLNTKKLKKENKK